MTGKAQGRMGSSSRCCREPAKKRVPAGELRTGALRPNHKARQGNVPQRGC
jgi:hypothetical protein